uniref:Uncharacterized protein n=1 Tax=Romanomermis culicivorax TaxID=13658 RepID=A0A915HRZ1_ROMCU
MGHRFRKELIVSRLRKRWHVGSVDAQNLGVKIRDSKVADIVLLQYDEDHFYYFFGKIVSLIIGRIVHENLKIVGCQIVRVQARRIADRRRSMADFSYLIDRQNVHFQEIWHTAKHLGCQARLPVDDFESPPMLTDTAIMVLVQPAHVMSCRFGSVSIEEQC